MRYPHVRLSLTARGVGPLLITVAVAVAALIAPAGAAEAAGTAYTMSFITAVAGRSIVAVDPATDAIYLADTSGGLSVIDGATGTVTTTISLSSEPRGIAVDSATDTIYVSLGPSTAGLIDVINGATNSVTATIAEPAGIPTGIAVDSATDTVYVADYSAAEISVINGATDTITDTIDTPAGTTPFAVAVDETSDTVWVAETSGAVIAIDGATDAVAASISLGTSEPLSIAVDPVTDTVYAGDEKNADVAVIDGATSALTTTIATGPYQFGVAVDPVTDTVYASSYSSQSAKYGTTWVIDGAGNTVTDTLARGGLEIATDPSTGIAYEAAELAGQQGAWVITPSAANSWSPVVSSPDADGFYTGEAGSFTTTADALPAATTFTETGALPAGLTFSADGTLAGTPPAGTAGDYEVMITASNAAGSGPAQELFVDVYAAVQITSAPVATFVAGEASSFALTASADPPASFSETGTLPSGVSLTDSGPGGWQLSGTPVRSSGGQYTFFIEASSGDLEATQAFTLTVLESPTFTSVPLATFRAGARGNFLVSAYGYPQPTFTATGAPSWLTVDPDGELNGLPGAHAGGDYSFTITASNGVGAASVQEFALTVDQVAAFTSARSATFRAGRRHTFTFVTTGFPPAHLTERGSLPAGVRFRSGRNGRAILTGDPARASIGKTYVITITANNVGRAVREKFRLKVS